MSRAPQEPSRPVVHTEEMVDWLCQSKDVPEELREAFLAAWVGAIRSAVLAQFKKQASEGRSKSVNSVLHEGALLSLDAGLAPEGWQDKDLLDEITRQTGLPPEAARALLAEVSAKLQKAGPIVEFEPVGQFQVQTAATGGFAVRCHTDFLQPKLEEPGDLLEGITDLEEEDLVMD